MNNPCSISKHGQNIQAERIITTRIFVGRILEEIATVELVDATDPGEHNGDTITDAEAGLTSRTNPLDDSTSQANVSIHYKAMGKRERYHLTS